MKVYIGPYIGSWSARKFQQWYLTKKYKTHYWEIDEEDYDKLDVFVDKLTDWWQDVLNFTINKYLNNKKRDVRIKLHNYDTWGMDHTVALIVLPMLKQLAATKHGSPFTDAEDAPHIGKGVDDGYGSDDKLHERWEWILNEMIYAFEAEADEDYEERFHSGVHDVVWEKNANGLTEMKKGPGDTHFFDREAYAKDYERRKNGLRLFGKYYHGLWD